MKPVYNVLHSHTTLSDGTLSHQEVLDMCPQYGIATVAFTDHDVLIPNEIFEQLMAGKRAADFISGIELSATGVKEVEGDIPNFHIVGLFVDHQDADLRTFSQKAITTRRERMNALVANLTAVGFSVTVKEVEKESNEGTVGRPHIVKALLAKPENVAIVQRTLERMSREADPSVKARYADIASHDLWQQTFDLFLGNEAYVPGIYVPYLKLSLDEAVTLIRGAGGLAILAHPSYYRAKVSVELVEQLAREGRIDGIETVYALSSKGRLEDDFRLDMEAYRDIARRYDLVTGGGGDLHTLQDFGVLKTAAARMEETVPFLERIFMKWPKDREKVYRKNIA